MDVDLLRLGYLEICIGRKVPSVLGQDRRPEFLDWTLPVASLVWPPLPLAKGGNGGWCGKALDIGLPLAVSKSNSTIKRNTQMLVGTASC